MKRVFLSRTSLLAICLVLVFLGLYLTSLNIGYAYADEVSTGGTAASQAEFVFPTEITAENIKQLVSEDLLHSGNHTTKYCQNYGYVINSLQGSNGVYNNLILFFNISFDDDGTEYGYTITIKPLKEVFVQYNNGNITLGAAPYHIGIGNIRIGSQIIDQESDSIDSGAFFTSVGFYGTSTQYAGTYQDEAVDSCIAMAVSVAGAVAGICSAVPGVGIVGTAIGIVSSIAGGTYGIVESVNALKQAEEDNWVANIGSENVLYFPPSKNGQLESDVCNYSLVKGILATETLDNTKLLSMGENGVENYSTIHYIFSNDDGIGFYALSNIEFACYIYDDTSSPIWLDRFEKNIVYDYSQIEPKIERVVKDNDGYKLDSHINMLPALSHKVFKVNCDRTGYYHVLSCIGYKGVFLDVTEYTKGYYLEAGHSYNLTVTKEGNQFNANYDVAQRLFEAQDFYSNEINFVPILILENQSVSNNDTISPGISYYTVTPNKSNCDMYRLDNVNNAETRLSICDNNLKVLCRGYAYLNGIYCNYPLIENNTYYIILDASESAIFEHYQSMDISKDNQIIPDNSEEVYYEYHSKYSTKYVISGEATCCIYSKEMSPVSENDGYYLFKDNLYFIKAKNQQSNIAVEFDSASATPIFVNEEKYVQTYDLTNIFVFHAPLKGLYSFNGVNCDIYKDNVLLDDNVASYSLSEDVNYTIISNDIDKIIKITPEVEKIKIGANNAFNFAYNNPQIYQVAVDSQILVKLRAYNGAFINEGYRIFDSDFIIINNYHDCHGFDLAIGTYYLVIDSLDNGQYSVVESMDIVKAQLVNVDGSIIKNVDLIFGQQITLPTQHKKGFDFIGWAWANNTNLVVTNEKGQSNVRLLIDKDVAFAAIFVAQSLTMQVAVGDNEVKWWTGNDIVDSKPMSTVVDLYEQLVNLMNVFASKPYGKKQGNFLSTFEITEDPLNNTNYIFVPVWVVEKYTIRLHYGYNSNQANLELEYGKKITGNWFIDDSKVENYRKLVGWTYGAVVCKPILELANGESVPDFTPGIASNYEIDGIPIVDINAETEYRKYTIAINNHSFEMTHADSYIFLAPYEYGYSESSYNGYNVWYSAANTNYYVNKDPLTNVDSNLTFVLDKKPVVVQITYSGVDHGNNPDTYKLTDSPKALSDCTKWDRQYKIEWSISELSRSSLFGKDFVWYSEPTLSITKNVELYYTYDLMKSISTGSSVSITQKVVCIFTTSNKDIRNITITIGSNVERITFEGNGKTWNDVKIKVSERPNKLYMNFKNNISFVGWSSKCVIDAQKCPDLEMYAYDSTKLACGELGLITPDPGAILCQGLTLCGAYFHIYAPSPKLELLIGSNGISGIYNGYRANAVITIDCEVVIAAGSGFMGTTGSKGADATSTGVTGNPGNTGGKGGDGGCGISTIGRVVITANASGTISGGNGGKGGTGGNGGNGAAGRNGKLGVTTINPGNGGNGGKGGKGGNAGRAISGVYSNYSNRVTLESGTRGDGGDGGNGGDPGATSYTIWNNPREGRKGDPGGKGDPGNT